MKERTRFNKTNILYGVIDRDTDETLFVGNIHEVSEYAGANENTIRSCIYHAARRGYRTKYVRIGREDDEDEW